MVRDGSVKVGSSPLTRGKPAPSPTREFKVRLIPAHAGKTIDAAPARLVSAAHPRSRGENTASALVAALNSGSSPLTRGKQRLTYRRTGSQRLIPAHAGKTPKRLPPSSLTPAHPRSRGENGDVAVGQAHEPGSSPLTRGKPRRGDKLADAGRLIPAHAGKTLPDLRFYCADRSDLGKP